MIPSQQAMMLEAAMAFEQIIKKPKGKKSEVSKYLLTLSLLIKVQLQGPEQITWDNPEQLEEYINKLQSAADRLTSENRRLRKCHGIMSEKVRNK